MRNLLNTGNARRNWIIGSLAIAVLFLAACGQVATPAPVVPTAVLPAAPTAVPPAAPTAVLPAAPTAVPPAAPTAVPPVAPTAVPPAAPTAVPVTAVPSAQVPANAYVEVENQAIANGTVTIREIVSAGAGWIVIHAQKDGGVGSGIGYAPVADGENKDVVVQIDATQATPTLYAMLHTDAGTVGAYEFPGADTPVKGDASQVNPSFTVSGLPKPSATADISLVNYSFDLSELTVSVGTTVVWTNKDNVMHTVTSDTGLFDSGSLRNGDTFSFTFDQAGTYLYYCRPHGGPGGAGMSGKIIVTQ